MRIVTHTCSNTEIVCALGLADQIVGVDDHSDFPPEVVSSKAKIGPDLGIDIERIIALKPDWVITSLTVPGHEHCVAQIKQAGLNCHVTQPTSLADVVSDIETLGVLLGREAPAQRLVQAFEQRMNQAKPDHPTIPIGVEWWPKPVIVPGAKSWVNEMLELVGGTNPFAHHPKESLEITAEDALEAQMAAVVMSWCGVQEDKYRPHIVKRRVDWAEVPAIKNNHIYPISEAWLGRPGPRLIEGMDRLAAVVSHVRASS